MICKIADLLTEIPTVGGMGPRCEEYLYDGHEEPEIVIDAKKYDASRWPEQYQHLTAYMDSGEMFYVYLLRFNGMMLHASAVEMNGKAYLFSGDCGAGKSTHTSLWQQAFGPAAQIFNDDKPALRFVNEKWYAYGTPWSGKNEINQNKKIPLAGICFMKKSNINKIRQLTKQEAMPMIFKQTIRRLSKAENMILLLNHIENLIARIPIYELENRPEPEAARLSYETMCRKAEELGL